MVKYVIISRHVGAIAWLNGMGYTGLVVPHFNIEAVESGVTYIGVLPINMIASVLARGGKFIVLSLPAIAFAERGVELSPMEMANAGASLYEVKNLVMEKI